MPVLSEYVDVKINYLKDKNLYKYDLDKIQQIIG